MEPLEAVDTTTEVDDSSIHYPLWVTLDTFNRYDSLFHPDFVSFFYGSRDSGKKFIEHVIPEEDYEIADELTKEHLRLFPRYFLLFAQSKLPRELDFPLELAGNDYPRPGCFDVLYSDDLDPRRLWEEYLIFVDEHRELLKLYVDHLSARSHEDRYKIKDFELTGREFVSLLPTIGTILKNHKGLGLGLILNGIETIQRYRDDPTYFDEFMRVLSIEDKGDDSEPSDDSFSMSKDDSWSVLGKFPFHVLDQPGGKDALLHLAIQVGRELDTVAPYVESTTDMEQIVCIDRVLQGHGKNMYLSHGKRAYEVYSEHWPFYQTLVTNLIRHRAAPDLIAEALEHTDSALFEEPCVTEIFRILKQKSSPEVGPQVADLMSYLSDPEKRAKYFKHVDLHRAYIDNPFADMSHLAAATPWRLIPDHQKFVLDLMDFTPFYAVTAFKGVPVEEYLENPQCFNNALEYWETSYWGLQSSYKKSKAKSFPNFMKRYRDAAYAIDSKCQAAAGHLLHEVPHTKWGSDGIHFARLFGEGAPRMYYHLWHYREQVMDAPEFKGIVRESKKHFRLSHFYRYVPADYFGRAEDYNIEDGRYYKLLKNNLENLDPEVRSDRKLGIIVCAQHDLNSAYRSVIRDNILQLDKLNYKVLFGEAKTTDEALEFISRMVELHRGVRGPVSEGAHYIGLHMHANTDGGAFGNSDYLGDKALLIRELNEKLRLSPYLAPDNPILNLTGCYIGWGGKLERAFAYDFNHWNKGITAYASTGSRAPKRIAIDNFGALTVKEGKTTKYFI